MRVGPFNKEFLIAPKPVRPTALPAIRPSIIPVAPKEPDSELRKANEEVFQILTLPPISKTKSPVPPRSTIKTPSPSFRSFGKFERPPTRNCHNPIVYDKNFDVNSETSTCDSSLLESN